MRVVTALIVDEIRDHDDGRVDLIGLREDLFFDQVPVLLEQMTLFLELELDEGDRGERHTLELRVVEWTGKVQKAIPVSFTVPPDYPRPTAPLDPTLFEVPFEQFGPHYLDIMANGEHARRLYLSILPRETSELEPVGVSA